LTSLVKLHIFTTLHAMQTRSSDENSVRLSICLSHACIVTKWKKDLSAIHSVLSLCMNITEYNKMLSYRRETALQGAL